MIIFRRAHDIANYINTTRSLNQSVAFVPTMGALHAGHASLVQIAKKENSLTVVSIFVNPLQFNDPKDFIKYPVSLERDIQLLMEMDADILFLPTEEEIYPDKKMKEQLFDLGSLDTKLEGSSRPGHFQGVCRVMDRLLTIVDPDDLYLGQKDFQQVMVIKRLIELKKFKAEIAMAPIIRENNGLAMSSRNVRLTEENKEKAPLIFQQLQFIAEHKSVQTFLHLKQHAIKTLQHAGFIVEYLALARQDDLSVLEEFSASEKMILLIAVFAGDIRLIDNLVL